VREIVDDVNSARKLYEAGRFVDALGVLGSATDPDSQLLIGACHARLRSVEKAVAVFTEILERDPDCFEALTWMAALKKNRQEIQDALSFARSAVRLQPSNAIAQSVLGGCYLYLRDPSNAIFAFEHAVLLDPYAAEHAHNLALSLLMGHRNAEAIEQLRTAISLAPDRPQSYLTLADAFMLYGKVGDALDCLSSGLAAIPNSAPLHSAAANAFSALRNDAAAERHHRSAMQLSPDAKGAYAAWLLNQGRFAESQAMYAELTGNPTTCAIGYYGMMQSRKLTEADRPLIREMEGAVADRRLGSGGEMRIRYALGKAYEQLREFGSAIGHFDAANELAFAIHHAGHPFSPEQLAEEHERVKSLYARIPSLTGSDSPIFIVGMIRSGTTLLDQIVSSHRSVSSAGELRFWMEETLRLAASPVPPSVEEVSELARQYVAYGRLLSGAAETFTDKMPLNFAYLGILAKALPNARFLHIRRHPIDTCLSIYTTYFGQGANFAYRRQNILAYYKAYQKMMSFWRQVVPQDRLFELDYEELIANPDGVVPAVIDFCGLPWDDMCLRHHENPVAINTPSRWQARQPIYKSSTERWKNYEPWLREFTELLA
jgi:tetratricopeptide (TPR) repeat protein